ncbi:hypothetical protein [Bifidobacterium crudilactis]|jgi:hypothetical protein|uniref:hypothetical protein n=1 Tax=Bifidobacterium crudilactis TaxID=327277 RepID=UPI0026487E68|nr:hypothetical protein [Bifidobacterium crudilactis]MDN5972153.1 hypothetical protein [Bifidobacterium crudilactis]MDN6000669.1 hypothetical protein [Bifidobacterium crudilactis]MDN6208548.1 hypothetical protein [Bifidobacterium crudilactis]MDN6233509.1 hypothetical protein [Bifidobacterium crudilactis]MDN6467626.1 hypothetical protein [Bifidobacterium crudilactis]
MTSSNKDKQISQDLALGELPPFLTEKQFSEITQISVPKLSMLRHQGVLPIVSESPVRYSRRLVERLYSGEFSI